MCTKGVFRADNPGKCSVGGCDRDSHRIQLVEDCLGADEKRRVG